MHVQCTLSDHINMFDDLLFFTANCNISAMNNLENFNCIDLVETCELAEYYFRWALDSGDRNELFDHWCFEEDRKLMLHMWCFQ